MKTAAFFSFPEKSHQLGLHRSMKQGADVILKDQPVQTFNLHIKTSSSTPGECPCAQTLRGVDGGQPLGRKKVLAWFREDN